MAAAFAGMNTGRVYGAIEQATSRKGQQGTASPQEAAERAAQLKTQGRKGCKAIRINMAFTPENHEFIKVMATISGKTMTEFANLIVERYRNEHPEIYEQAKAIIDQL
jgi:enhancing lycopene biosynthesis protein 2